MIKSPKSAEYVSTDDKSSSDEDIRQSSENFSSDDEKSQSPDIILFSDKDNTTLSNEEEAPLSGKASHNESEITADIDSPGTPNMKPTGLSSTDNTSKERPRRKRSQKRCLPILPSKEHTKQSPGVAKNQNNPISTSDIFSRITRQFLTKRNKCYDPIKEQESCARFISKVRLVHAHKRKTHLIGNIPAIAKDATSMAGSSGITHKRMRRGGKQNANVQFKEPTVTPKTRVIQQVIRSCPARAMWAVIQITSIRNGSIGTAKTAEPVIPSERLHRDGLHFFFENNAPEIKEAMFSNATGLGIAWPCWVEGREIGITEISHIIKKMLRASYLRLEIKIDSSDKLAETILRITGLKPWTPLTVIANST
uniref:RNase H domain-containing protein n=1 Tax=Strongyloides venezuelensis TaxID=75913 RepID=A0A0K0EWM5_STRVS